MILTPWVLQVIDHFGEGHQTCPSCLRQADRTTNGNNTERNLEPMDQSTYAYPLGYEMQG